MPVSTHPVPTPVLSTYRLQLHGPDAQGAGPSLSLADATAKFRTVADVLTSSNATHCIAA